MDNSKYLKLFSDCIPVKGASRSCIYDLGRNTYQLIPNALYELLVTDEGKKISDIIEQHDNHPVIIEYLEFLLTSEFIYLCDKKELKRFPKLTHKYLSPDHITNAILIRDQKSNFDFKTIINQLEELGCKHIQLIITEDINIEILKSLIDHTNKSILQAIDVTIPWKNNDDIQNIIELNKQNKRLKRVYFYNADHNEIINKEELDILILKNSKEDIITNSSPDPSYFRVNMTLFNESLGYNSFFNRKLIIDEKDNIKRTLDQKDTKIFGNITSTKIKEIINDEGFRKYWNVNKDSIKTCKDCEFRHMCVDTRTPIHENQEWHYEKKCSYDPYTNTWTN